MKNKDRIIPKSILGPSLKFNIFKDKDGNKIDPSKYCQMIVVGESLEPCNVKDGNMLFINNKLSLSDFSNMKLPKICVFHRGNKFSDMKNNKSKYVVGDVFCSISKFTDISFELDYIIKSDKFQKYRNDVRYVSDKWIIEEFKNNIRHQELPNNISIYPNLNYDNVWVFEWVDSADFFGVVEEVFTIDK